MERISFPIQLAQTLMEGVAVEDDAGHLIFVNRTLEQILGYRSGELIGQPWSLLLPEPKEEEDNPANCSKVYLNCRDGTPVSALAAAWRVPVSTDCEPRRLSVFTDFAKHHGSPSPLVQPGNEDGWDERLASVAHELNNPLTIITIQSQLLARQDSSTPLLGDHLAIIQDQVQRMKRIIEDLRASSHPHSPHLEPTDIHALIRRTLDIQEYQLQAAGVQVATALSPMPIDVEADPYQLQQVFVNLITNACQALAEADYPRKLLIATNAIIGQDRQASRLLIRFHNNGPTIPADVMSHIFEPFFTTKKQDRGTGLGLSVCKRIVQAHGGRIWAENDTKSGVTFTVELPLSDPAADVPKPPLASPRQEATPLAQPRMTVTGPHILVVDDELSIVRAAEQLLRQAGFEVTSTTMVKQALQALERKQVDLILSDLSMPQIDGAQFYRLVSTLHPRLARRIIFSTGDTGSQRLRSFLEECGCAWIGKPFQPDELLHLIQGTLAEVSTPASARKER